LTNSRHVVGNERETDTIGVESAHGQVGDHG
jgi:hypothetical protein